MSAHCDVWDQRNQTRLMNDSQPDNEQCPYHRVPSPWIVFVGTLSLFAGLNLRTYTLSQGGCGDEAGFPFVFYSTGGISGAIHFDELLLLANIGIAFGAAAGLTYLMRNGWWEFWHWLRTAGVNYASDEEEDV